MRIFNKYLLIQSVKNMKRQRMIGLQLKELTLVFFMVYKHSVYKDYYVLNLVFLWTWNIVRVLSKSGWLDMQGFQVGLRIKNYMPSILAGWKCQLVKEED